MQLITRKLRIREIGDVLRCRCAMPPGAHPETTPVFLNLGDRYGMTVSTGYTVLIPFRKGCVPLDLFHDGEALEPEARRVIVDNGTGYGASQNGGEWTAEADFNAAASWDEGYPYWRRQYYGVYDGYIADDRVFLLMHGENKNEKTADGRVFINSVQPRRDYRPDEFSGPRLVDGQWAYDDYGDSYFAFAGGIRCTVDALLAGEPLDGDMGPILWPAEGYLDDGQARINTGMRHPSLLVHDGFAYVYYLDDEYVRAARAPLDGDGMPGGFSRCVNGAFSLPALPEGFHPSARRFFYEGAGEADSLLPGDRSLRFSAAAIRDAGLFLGVQEYYTEWPRTGMRFWLSDDLVHWDSPLEIPGMRFGNYNDGTLHYPMLYNADMTEKDVIDLDDFHIVGEWGNNIGRPAVECRHFRLSL